MKFPSSHYDRVAYAPGPDRINPPIEKRTYILGVIDSHGAVHSVIIGSPGQVHEDFWPIPAPKRWRYAIWRKQLCVLGDAAGNPRFDLTVEERDAVQQHLARKGYELT